jgi:anti-sigma-K factor RskA
MTEEERDALAAEYVLGTLEAREAAHVAALIERDAALAEAVAGWEARLAPLQALAPPEAPPPGLFRRIERSLDGPREPWRFPWGFFGLGASAVAAGLAAFLVLRPAPLMTVLLTDRDQSAFWSRPGATASASPRSNPRSIPEGRAAQLWALPQGRHRADLARPDPDAGRSPSRSARSGPSRAC